jgi:hypothetical protein
MLKPSTKKTIFTLGGIIIVILIFSVSKIHFHKYSCKEPTVIDTLSVLMHAASEVNQSMPVWVDKNTRCNNISVTINGEFQYNFTLVNLSHVDKKGLLLYKYLIQGGRDNIINAIRTEPKMEGLKKLKPTFIYSYSDKDGNYLFSISIEPGEYQNISQQDMK